MSLKQVTWIRVGSNCLQIWHLIHGEKTLPIWPCIWGTVMLPNGSGDNNVPLNQHFNHKDKSFSWTVPLYHITVPQYWHWIGENFCPKFSTLNQGTESVLQIGHLNQGTEISPQLSILSGTVMLPNIGIWIRDNNVPLSQHFNHRDKSGLLNGISLSGEQWCSPNIGM